MINSIQDQQTFNQDLQEYWEIKGITPKRHPVFGGRDLDFYTLYRSVIQRGGIQQVYSNNLWKEVIDELRLPSTATSATFHIKKYYEKFLLGYEMKNTPGQDDSQIPIIHQQSSNIKKTRPRNTQPKENNNNNNQAEQEEDSSDSSSSISDGQIETEKVLHPSQVNPLKSHLGQDLTKQYEDKDKKEEIYYVQKTKMIPTKQEIKRITLAFESRLQDEVVYALNTLMLYSVNMETFFLFDKAQGLLNNIQKYLEENIQNIPSLNQILDLKVSPNKPKEQSNLINSLNILENFNYPVSTIILFNLKNNVEISPLKLLQKQKTENIQNLYEQGEVQLLEQIRTIFQILRNLSFIRSNQISILKNDKLCGLVIQLFLLNSDVEISRLTLDIISNISQHIQLNKVPNYEKFCLRLFEVLYSDNNEELEAGVYCMKSLIAQQDNESIMESHLEKYIDAITRLLLYSHGTIREGVLEFLCYLSDLKLNTKVVLAKQYKLVMRLIGLLGSGIGKQYEKITKLSAHIISNILLAPASQQYILPFEKELFIIASTNEHLSEQLDEIIYQLHNYELQEKY